MAVATEHAMVPASNGAEASVAAAEAAAATAQPPFAVVATPTNALSRLPSGGWSEVPNLATMLGALPLSYQEHVAMLLWGTANLKIWFTDSHGDDPDRSEYPQFFMSRLSYFHVQVGGKFLPGETVLVTLHEAFSHDMIRNEDLTKDTCSIFTHRLQKSRRKSKTDMDAQPEGDADAMEVMAEAVEIPEGAEGEEAEELPQAEVVAARVAVAEQDAGPGEVVATESEVVHPGNRVRPKFESKLVAVNDKGCATVSVHFGCTSRHVAKFRNRPMPVVMRAEFVGADPGEEPRVAWSQPFVIIARDDDNTGKKLKAARRLAHDLSTGGEKKPKKASVVGARACAQ
tara:strand:- start:949 stop:1977 length:1029 start_codon:yes stop_codon:yes gene_type:complete